MKTTWANSISVTCSKCNEEIKVGFNYSSGSPASGEYMYSLGSPAEDASAELEYDECPHCGTPLDTEDIESEACSKEEEHIEDSKYDYADYRYDRMKDDGF